ncbi:hypothetical protein DBR32_11690 [Taibaiella sp. KBW10]|nr:hypothetical protein DBR32_11690 [Taibaiella sp. KBW10]
MAAFLLIIMGAVSFIIMALLGETKAAVVSSEAILYRTVSAIYIVSGILILFITIRFNKKITIPKNSTKLRIAEIVMLLPVSIFCFTKAWYVPAAFSAVGIFGILYAFLYENTAAKPNIVQISKDGITIPNHKTSFLSWDKVLRLIVRHQILTIEVTGNKLFQLDLSSDQKPDVESIESFALIHIKENKKVIKNDW